MTDVSALKSHTFVCDAGACEEYESVIAEEGLLRNILIRDYGWVCTSDDKGAIEDLCAVHGAEFQENMRPVHGNVSAACRATHAVTGRYVLDINARTIICSVMECKSKGFGVSGESMRATMDRLKTIGWAYRNFGWNKMKSVVMCPDHLAR